MTEERLGFIYGLTDPRTGDIRYVDKTVVSPHIRYKVHMRQALADKIVGHKSSWIRQLDSLGLRPELVIIDYDVPETEINDLERYWVQTGRSWGWDLTNETVGGEGALRFSADSRRNLSEALKGRIFSPGHIEKLRIASTGRRHSPEVIARITEKNRGRKLSPEHAQAFSQYWVGKKHSPEHRQKVSDAKTGLTLSDETKDKIRQKALGRAVSSETKEKLRKATTGKKRSEETKRRMSEAAKRRWAREKGTEVVIDGSPS